jgi:hypothetical protein
MLSDRVHDGARETWRTVSDPVHDLGVDFVTVLRDRKRAPLRVVRVDEEPHVVRFVDRSPSVGDEKVVKRLRRYPS